MTIEPDFAEAHAALALTQMQFLFGGPFSPHETVPKAEAAARKAMQLDDTLAQAHRVLGQILGLVSLALGGERKEPCSVPPNCGTAAMSWRPR